MASFLRLFGAARLECDGASLPFASERRFQLLAYLACFGDWVARDKLAALFFGDRSEHLARSNLRNLVMQLRREAIDNLETRAGALRWQIGSDVRDFERSVAAKDWQSALDLHAGPLLDRFELGAPPAFGDWLRFERARLQALCQDALTARLAQLDAQPQRCAELAQQALRSDPLNDVALAAYLRAQVALGSSIEAQRVWRSYVERLAIEHGIEPTAGLRAIAARLHDGPDLRMPPAAATPPGADCVGRRVELSQMRELLADARCRLLTVAGPGGVGKSTLARAAGPALSAQFVDRTVWVELEDLTQTDVVAPRIAARIGLQLSGTETPLAQVTRHLRDKELLVVFDNAEHLSGFDRLVEVLLHDCSRLKLLVTSRARLAVPGEWLLPLDGLPVPDRDEMDLDVLRAFDAVKLFELRARAMSPGFDLAPQAADVVALAHAVEGLPLALELAAAWTRLLPVREIVRELAHSLDMLESPGGAGARERSLRASFEHSWNLLAPVERDTLPRLAMFVGSFSRAAASDIARSPLPVLAALVDKSLLRSSGDGRFSVHPLVRQSASEHLVDAQVVRRRHADYYAQHMSRHRVFDATALVEVELELPNLLAGWQTSIEFRLPDNIEKMAPLLGRFFDVQFRLAEGAAAMRSAVQTFDPLIATERCAHAIAQQNLAQMLVRQTRLTEAEETARSALRSSVSARDRRAIAGCLHVLGKCLSQRGLRIEARRCYERGLRRARADGDDLQANRLEFSLAVVEQALGRYDDALALFERVSTEQRQSGDLVGLVATLNSIGELQRVRRAPTAALPPLEEGLRLCQDAGIVHEPFLLFNLAWAHLDLGSPERAAHYAAQALSRAIERGIRQLEVVTPLLLARVAMALGHSERALQHLQGSLALSRESRYEIYQVSAVGVYANWLATTDRRVQAAACWHFVIAAPRAQMAYRDEARQALERLALSVAERDSAREAAARLTLEVAVDTILTATP